MFGLVLDVHTSVLPCHGWCQYYNAVFKPNSHSYSSTAILHAMAWSSVAWCQTVFFGAKLSVRHFGTSTDLHIYNLDTVPPTDVV